jgi:hypothetical protein
MWKQYVSFRFRNRLHWTQTSRLLRSVYYFPPSSLLNRTDFFSGDFSYLCFSLKRLIHRYSQFMPIRYWDRPNVHRRQITVLNCLQSVPDYSTMAVTFHLFPFLCCTHILNLTQRMMFCTLHPSVCNHTELTIECWILCNSLLHAWENNG